MEHKSVLYSTDNLNDISVEGNCKQDLTDKISSTDYSWKVDYGYVKNTEELLLSTTLSKSVKLLSEQKKVTLLTTILASLHILFLCNNSEEDVEIEMMLDSSQQGYKENGEIIDSTIINTKVSKIMKFHDFLQEINFETCEYYSGHNYQKNDKKLNGEFDFLLGTRFIVKVNGSMYVSNSKIIGLENNSGQFDFQIKFSENTNRLKISLEYNKNQVNSQKNSGILESFNALLSNIVLNSDQCLGEFSLLTNYEQQMLLDWNKTETEYPKDKCVHQLFQEQVEVYPDTI
ncbi:hypothetical protein, partial [Bacillus cereus group sp. BfR-BA-01381]|uniref:hypothetical protein n=1 Tax=Bacillus cereus group sp. BfR-BA-01381 TaxID=2920325 RepID=UPI001F596AA7